MIECLHSHVKYGAVSARPTLKSQMRIFQWTSNRLSEQSWGNQGDASKITTPEALEMSKYNPITNQAKHRNRITPPIITFLKLSQQYPPELLNHKSSAVHLRDILNNLTEYYNILSPLQHHWQCRYEKKKKLILKYLPYPEKVASSTHKLSLHYCAFETAGKKPTWVWAVHVDELIPLVVLDEGDQSVLELRSQLDHKLVVGVDGEARRDETYMQSTAKRHQHVHGLPVIQADDSVDSFRELRTNWEEHRKTKCKTIEWIDLIQNYLFMQKDRIYTGSIYEGSLQTFCWLSE